MKGRVSNIIESSKSQTWIITLLLSLSAIAIIANLGVDFFIHLKGSESTGPTYDKEFVLQFVLSLVFLVCVMCAIIFYKLKQGRQISKITYIIMLFLFPLFLNELVFTSEIILFGFFEKLEAGLYLLGILFVNLITYFSGFFVFLEKVIETGRKEEDVVEIARLEFRGNVRRMLFLNIPVFLFMISLVIFGPDESRYVFISAMIAIALAFYMSSFGIFHLACFMGKLSKFLKRKNEEKISAKSR